MKIKKRAIILIILCLYLFSICLTSIIYISNNFLKSEVDNKYFQDVENNLKQNFIQSIDIQKTPCQDSSNNSFNLTFEGVDPFCLCNSNKNYAGACNKHDRQSTSCDDTSEIKKKKINNLKKIYFCKTINSITYDKVENINMETKLCKKEFKVCGKDSFSSLCFPKMLDCPINDIIISDTKRSDLLDYTEKSETSPSTNEIIYLYFTNKKIDNDIPVDFKIGLNEICIDPNEEITYTSQFPYFKKQYDEKCDSEIGNKNIDFRYKKIYSLNKFQLYNDNGITNQIKEKYEIFDTKTLNYQIDIFSRPFIHFSTNCKNNINIIKNKSLTKISILDIITLSDSHMLIFTVGIFFAGLALMASCASLIINVCCSWNSKLYNLKKLFIPFSIVIVFFLVVIILNFVTMSDNNKKIEILDELYSSNCGDYFFNQFISKGRDSSRKQNKDNIIIIILFFLGIFLILIYSFCIFWFFIKHKSKNKNKNQNPIKEDKILFNNYINEKGGFNQTNKNDKDFYDNNNLNQNSQNFKNNLNDIPYQQNYNYNQQPNINNNNYQQNYNYNQEPNINKNNYQENFNNFNNQPDLNNNNYQKNFNQKNLNNNNYQQNFKFPDLNTDNKKTKNL